MTYSNEIITSAPNQNRGGVIQPTRLISIALSEILTRINEVKTDLPFRRVHLWNNIGSNINGGSIEQKYTYLASQGLAFPELQLEFDDSEEFEEFLRTSLYSLVKSNIIYADEDEYSVCGECGYCVGLSSNNRIASCSKCKSDNIELKKRQGLFIDLPEDKVSLIKDKTLAFKNTTHLYARFNHLPNRINLEKIRPIGLKLDFLGFDDYVLDPKFGISLLPHFVAQKYNLNKITQIQGYETVTNTAPYTNLIASNIDFKYILTGLVSNDCHFDDTDLGFVFYHLPLFLVGLDTTVSPARVEQLKLDYQNTAKRLIALLASIKATSSSTSEIQLNILDKAIDYFMNYKFKDGITLIKGFLKQFNLDSDLASTISTSDLAKINQVFSLAFKI